MLRRMTLFVLTGLTLASLDPSANEVHGSRRTHPRRAGEAAVLAQRHVAGTEDDGRGRHPEDLADLGAIVRIQEARAHAGRGHRVRRLEAARLWRSGTSPTWSRRTSATATSPSDSRDLSVDARAGRRAAALRTDARAVACRHALARRPPGLQHPGDNAQRIARRHAGRGRDRTGAAGHAPRRASRSAALRPHVVMGGVRLIDPLEQQLLDNSRIEQLSVDDLRHATPAVFAQLDRLNRHHRTRSTSTSTWTCSIRARSWRTEQGAQRAVERGAGGALRADLQPLSEGVGDRLRDHSARTKAGSRSRPSTG